MKLRYGVTVESTETFRFAMNLSPFERGLNGHTLPNGLRYIYEPPPGRVFVSGDGSQIEARWVAYLAKCKDLIELFSDPARHVHLENAILVFGHPVEKDSPDYRLAKALVHGVHYREGPFLMSTKLGIPIKETRKLRANYLSKRPEILQWHQWTYDQIKERGKLETPFGDERTFYEALSCLSLTGKMTDHQWNDAVAWVPQSMTPAWTHRGINNIYYSGVDYASWHHEGHDSFVAAIPPERTVEFAELAERSFKIPVTIHGVTMYVPLVLSVGYNLGDMMKYKGSVITRPEWERWLASELDKQSREQRIIEGIYASMLKGFHP